MRLLGYVWRSGLDCSVRSAAQISARDRDRMSKRSNDPPQASHGLVEEADLAQHRSAVIVDSLACQSVIGVECVDSAKPEFNRSTRRWQSAPATLCVPRMVTSSTRLSVATCRCPTSIEVIQVPALIVIGIWIVLQFLSGIGSITNTAQTSGVAYMAHIRRFLAGVALTLLLRATGGTSHKNA
jgi:hypothetical protein